ncbi:inositol monophosphatase family protein [Parapontixanthobacter aurantiacus]
MKSLSKADRSLDKAIHALMKRTAETAILPHFQSLDAGDIESKATDDVVTIADHAAERMLADGLAEIDSSLAIVGEEAVHADPSVREGLTRPCWIIDPLDGTNNFAKGNPPFGMILAQAENGIATKGWIYDCLTGRFCSAHRGSGAWADGEPVRASETGQDKPVAAISLVFMQEEHREAIREHIAPHYQLVDIPRCAAEQYPRLAFGTNDVSIFERTLSWDHAAGALWLNEAGGKVARLDGSEYRVNEPNRTGLVGAASPRLFDDLAERLAALPARSA